MLLEGKRHHDERGVITYNNEFDASQIKRIYTIENASLNFVRGWQGHKIEQRWFAAMRGSFKVKVRRVKDFNQDISSSDTQEFILNDNTLTFLHVPAGHITAIQALEENSKLLAMGDYALGEIDDEYRFEYKQD